MMSDVLLAAGSSFGLSVALKSTLLVVLGLTVSGLLGRRACSSIRHLVLVVTFGALLALPAVADESCRAGPAERERVCGTGEERCGRLECAAGRFAETSTPPTGSRRTGASRA